MYEHIRKRLKTSRSKVRVRTWKLYLWLKQKNTISLPVTVIQSLNSHYRIWGHVVGTKTVKFCVGNHVRKQRFPATVSMYIWGFRARQHLRLLPPVMNDDWWWWPNEIRGPLVSKAFRHVLQVRKKPRKNLTQEICPDRGSNPGPLRGRRACYRLAHSGGLPATNKIPSHHMLNSPTSAT